MDSFTSRKKRGIELSLGEEKEWVHWNKLSNKFVRMLHHVKKKKQDEPSNQQTDIERQAGPICQLPH